MAYLQVWNQVSMNAREKEQVIREFNNLRQELDEVRANFNAVLTKLDSDAGVTDVNYNSLYSLGTTGSSVTAAAAPARRFTPT